MVFYRLTDEAAEATIKTLETLGQIDPVLHTSQCSARGAKGKLVFRTTGKLIASGVSDWLKEQPVDNFEADRILLTAQLTDKRVSKFSKDIENLTSEVDYLPKLIQAVNCLVEDRFAKAGETLRKDLHETLTRAKIDFLVLQKGKAPYLKFEHKEELCEAVGEDGELIKDFDFCYPTQRANFLKLFDVPALPKHHVERQKPFEAVKELLLGRDKRYGTLVVSAIKGMGGIGKSILAAALAHNEDIQRRFKDGVLWVTLGQKPDVLPLLQNWIHNGIGDSYEPTSVKDASGKLHNLLQNKHMLLVIDDAWNKGDIQPFLVAGQHCCVLVTTREVALENATYYPLDVMSEDEAKEMLAPTFGDRQQIERIAAMEFAKQAGYLPLALKIGIALTEKGRLLWQQILEYFNEAKSALKEPGNQNISLKACFNISFNNENISENRKNFLLEQYAWLGVLSEDSIVTDAIANRLWNLSKSHEATETLMDFEAMSLLQENGYWLDPEKQRKIPAYRMHDLMHDFAKELIQADPKTDDEYTLPGLGLSLKEAHGALLERYWSKIQASELEPAGWHLLKDDGYIHRHLTWHMVQADKTDAIHELLQETNAAGHNGWHNACGRLGQSSIFMADVVKAWDLVDTETEQASKERMPSLIGLHSRYLLITASLNNLLAKTSKLLLIQLLIRDVWTPEQGLAYGQKIADLSQRSACLLSLSAFFHGNQRSSILEESLRAAEEIQNEEDRANALTALGQHWPDALPKALEAAEKIQSEQQRELTLRRLWQHLPDSLLPQALEAAENIQNEWERAWALAKLGPHLSDVLIPQAFEAAENIQDEWHRAMVLTALGPHLPNSLLTQALEAAENIQNEWKRTDALVALGPRLPDSLLPQALEAAENIQNEWKRADALVALGPHLPDSLLPQALEAAENIQNEWKHTDALIALGQHWPDLLPKALEAVEKIQNAWGRVQALTALGQHLPNSLLPKALEAVEKIQDEEYRANALKKLWPHLSGSLLPQALEAVEKIHYEAYRTDAIIALGQHWPEALPQALEAVEKIQDERTRAYQLTKLWPHLLDSLLPQALEAAENIQDEEYRADALKKLWPHLPDSLLPKALEAAEKIHSEHHREQTLTSLGPYLPGSLLPQALKAVEKIQDEEYRADALTTLGQHWPETLPQAFEAAEKIQDEKTRADALTTLGQHWPEALPKALEAVEKIQDEKTRADALIALGEHWPDALPKALEAAEKIKYEKTRADALKTLGQHLPNSLLPQALEAAEKIQYEETRADALTALGQYWPEALPKALEAAENIQSEGYRADALVALGQYWPDAIPQALEAVEKIQDEETRADALTALGQYWPEALPKALEAAEKIQKEWKRAHVLLALIRINTHQSQATYFTILKALSTCYRPSALTGLSASIPLLLTLGGEPALREIKNAISDVCRWWP